MYRLLDYKKHWVLIVKNDKIVYVVKNTPFTCPKWNIGDTYGGVGDTLINTSNDLNKLIEIAMIYVL